MGLADQDTLRALLPLIFQLSERSSIGFLRGQTLGSIRLHRFKPSFQGRFSNIQMSVLQIFWLEQNTRPKNRSEHSVVHSWLGNLIHQKPTKIQRSLLVTWSNENLVTLTLGKCLCSVVGSDQSPVQTWVQNRYLAISGWIQGFCPMTLPKTFIFPSFNKTLPVIFSPRLAKKWYHIQEQWSMMCQNFHSWWDQKKSVEVSHPNRGKKKKRVLVPDGVPGRYGASCVGGAAVTAEGKCATCKLPKGDLLGSHAFSDDSVLEKTSFSIGNSGSFFTRLLSLKVLFHLVFRQMRNLPKAWETFLDKATIKLRIPY